MAKPTYNGGIKTAFDPIFAPITYGDDRQVTRTRRGIHCQIENNLDPSLVYCKCESCKYEWIMDKLRYITGTGDIGNRPNPYLTKNIGIGGTGLWIGNFINPETNDIRNPELPSDVSAHYDYDPIDGKYYGNRYKQYTHLAHDTSYCKTTTKECDEDGLIYACDFYPLTGGTGKNGEIDPSQVKDLYYDPVTGALCGNKESAYLGPAIPVYVDCQEEIQKKVPIPGGKFPGTIINHPGPSGSYGAAGHPLPRAFGGYPMACPNCCKVNFLAKWIELDDRPYPYGDYQHVTVGDIPSNPVEIPLLNDQSEYLPWAYKNKYLARFDFTGSTTWFVQDDVFKQHVALLVFNENGIIIKEENIDKILINHLTGGLTVIHPEAISGYVWVVKPFTELTDYIPNIDNVCTAIIVRDHQRIKTHFNESAS